MSFPTTHTRILRFTVWEHDVPVVIEWKIVANQITKRTIRFDTRRDIGQVIYDECMKAAILVAGHAELQWSEKWA